MNAQPIPGPYAFDPDAGSIESADGVVVATLSSVESFPCRDTEKDDEFGAELAATGRVLAAAPEMLIQLKGLLGFAQFIINAIDLDTDRTTVVLRANGQTVAEVPVAVVLQNTEAAIAKAEGRS